MERDNGVLLSVGTHLQQGKYVVEGVLGSGGFAKTYRVRNVLFDEEFAMKEFFWQDFNIRDGNDVSVSNPSKIADVEGQKEKFKKEAQRLRKISHPHIVKIHDLFPENGTVYYIMDYLGGGTLSDLINRRGAMSIQELFPILSQILDALDAIHKESIFHMDIKPNNIMFDTRGNAYLIDFGASKQTVIVDGSMTSFVMPYTKGYAPMEQVDQELDKVGPWTDFYALGATMYKLLTLNQPPSTSEILSFSENAFDFSQVPNKGIQHLIVWMMNPNREGRPRSVQEIRNYMRQTQSIFSRLFLESETTSFGGIAHRPNSPVLSREMSGQEKHTDDEDTIFGQEVQSSTKKNEERTIFFKEEVQAIRKVSNKNKRPARSFLYKAKKKIKNILSSYIVILILMSIVGLGGIGLFSYYLGAYLGADNRKFRQEFRDKLEKGDGNVTIEEIQKYQHGLLPGSNEYRRLEELKRRKRQDEYINDQLSDTTSYIYKLRREEEQRYIEEQLADPNSEMSKIKKRIEQRKKAKEDSN